MVALYSFGDKLWFVEISHCQANNLSPLVCSYFNSPITRKVFFLTSMKPIDLYPLSSLYFAHLNAQNNI